VRASRLINLLLLLQTRGQMTAAQLAQELEVSERTIHRDVEALSGAGIPVYAERGPHGGVALIEGYRTRLTGMTAEEAEALFLSGVPGPAAELGLGTVMASSQLKVLAALPPELRSRASRLVERFHLDATGWFKTGEETPFLPILAEAVWEGHAVDVVYQHGEHIRERRIQPLGLVLKAGVWYVVARSEEGTRTYRVVRVRSAEPVPSERFTRPTDFDLATYWAESTSTYERNIDRMEVTLRVHPRAMHMLADVAGASALRDAVRLTPLEADPDGWLVLCVRMDWPDEVPSRLLALGPLAEVLEPKEVRAQVAELARQVSERYMTPPVAEPAQP
jgi:predicted DNA-binding transcriptional regulator YafY